MPKVLLPPADCVRLHGHVKSIIDFSNAIPDPNPDVEDCIKNPQVPPRLSESMVLNALRNGTILINNANNHALFNYGRHRGDYDIEYNRNVAAARIKIEVKATGSDIFQRFRHHAMWSDVVIWIDFHGLRMQPTTLHYTVYAFRTALVFNNFRHLTEKEMPLNRLLANYPVIAYVAGTVI